MPKGRSSLVARRLLCGCIRSRLIVCCAFFAACSTTDEWKPTKPGEIFRFTLVGRPPSLDSIVLGKTWRSAGKYGALDGDTLTALPFGSFGGADAITVHRDSNGVVTEIDFAYQPERDLRALTHDYESSLGRPFSITVDTVRNIVRTTTTWRDQETEFTMAMISPPLTDGFGGIARLVDRHTAQRQPGGEMPRTHDER